MAYKAVLVAALGSVVLVGCGSGSDSVGPVSEYSLSDYEGRTVSEATLAGTWVAVGTGYQEASSSKGTSTKNFATKEYFVITGTDGNYVKSSCSYSSTYNISQEGDRIEFDDFVGSLTSNKSMTGKIEESFSYEDEDYVETSETNLTAVKISDDTGSVATITAVVNGQDSEAELFCYQQSNSVAKFKSLSAVSEEISTSILDLERWTGDDGYTALYSSEYSVDLDTDFGDSVNFEINVDSSLSETVNFNATDGSASVTGSIVVQLPVQ